MFNTMDNSMQSENNPIDSLNYVWEAKFNDGKIICQMEEKDKGLYQEVLDNMENLEFFCLYNKNNLNEKYIVDMKQGVIRTAYSIYTDTFNKERNNIRLIYFRTVTVVVSNMIEKYRDIKYFLGLQYLDKNESNQKILMCIDNSGKILIGD